MAYGSPNSLDEVAEYLRQVRGGRPPTDAEVERLRERYRRVGGRTPLLNITLAQARALQDKLDATKASAKVYIGMKHWHPFVEDTVETIVRDGAASVVGVALAPHYAKLSIGGYEDGVRRGLEKTSSQLPFSMVKHWHTQPHLIRALSGRVRNGLESFERPSHAAVLFTAHSLPKKFVASDDPYEAQLRETSGLVAAQAHVGFWDFAFQSAGEPVDSWLGPMIKEKMAELSKRFREVLICPVGFVSDHLEILYDLDIEAKEYGQTMGMNVARTASLNDDPEFIDALEATVKPCLTVQALA